MSETLGWVDAADGTRIAYRSEGAGPALLLSTGLTTSIAFWKYVMPIWARHYRVICWDLPSHGRSQRARTPRTLEIEAQPEIICRILDAAGVERAAQVGFSVGCQIALEMVRQFPERCSSAILLLGAAGHVFDTLALPVGKLLPKLLLRMPEPLFASWYAALARAAKRPFAAVLARRSGMIGADVRDEDLQLLLEHLAGLSPVDIQRMARSAARHTAEDVLASTTLPVLIVAGRDDPFAPLESVGRVLAARSAPATQLVEIAGGAHTALWEYPEAIAQVVERFLGSLGDAANDARAG
jgi:3-oxoadipate enol-lactonase/4-carboxymuconolactone decarboxylase